MTRPSQTGQAVRTLRKICLPFLCVLLLPLGLAASDGVQDPQQRPEATEPAAKNKPGNQPEQKSPENQDVDKNGNAAGAHPAPEPDTWMLLGTGAIVLLILYTRRRVRVVAPRTASHQ